MRQPADPILQSIHPEKRSTIDLGEDGRKQTARKGKVRKKGKKEKEESKRKSRAAEEEEEEEGTASRDSAVREVKTE
jgi:hypothetical protein